VSSDQATDLLNVLKASGEILAKLTIQMDVLAFLLLALIFLVAVFSRRR